MDNLNKFIEHTLLKQDAKKEDLIKLFAFLGSLCKSLLCKNGKRFLERY